ncbi:MAG: hypothetical protein KAY37_07875 [Phycisphaerae bacterium]|nr:hypothetical protein [Phycisphaerae bacterium]
MREVSGQNFGFLIAYVLPGFVSLWGVSHFSPTVRGWLVASSVTAGNSATVGGFLYVTLASVAAGLTASTIRWAVIDSLHHWTGINRPAWDDSKLQERLGAFEALVENHYRYYQFYANMLVAMLWLVAARLAASGRCVTELDPLDCGILAVGLLYWAGSRDTLRNYYTRAAFLLGTKESEVSDDERTRCSRDRVDDSGTQAEAAQDKPANNDETSGPADHGA